MWSFLIGRACVCSLCKGVCALFATYCVMLYGLCFACVVNACVRESVNVCALFATYCVMLYGACLGLLLVLM